MKFLKTLFAVSAVLYAGQAQAATLNINPLNYAQSQFDALSDDLGAATWMTPSNSAEAHSAGIIPVGIQAAVEITGLKIDETQPHWQNSGATGLGGTLPVPRVRISAGIPFGVDLGYMVSQVPDSNIKMTGIEGRFGFGKFIPVPMLEANVRYHQSSLTGIPDMEIKNSGFAAMFGANLPIVKPYIEFGTVTSTSTPSGSLALLSEHKTTNSTTAIGAKVELAFFVINVEKATVGDKDLTSLKVGFEF